ncbi:MAG: MFS transporter [Caldisphaera sp.]
MKVRKQEGILITVMSLNGIIFGSSQLVNPLYLKDLGLNSAIIGFLLTGQMLIGSMLSITLSIFGDAYGRKKFAILSRAISITGLFILFLGIPFGILMSTLMGGGGLIGALMAEKSRDLDKNLSIAYSSSTFLSILGALLPIFISLRYIILINLFIVTLAAILLLFVKEEYKGMGKIDIRLKSINKVAKLSVESFIGLGAGLILPIMSLWFYLRFNVSAQQMSPVFAISDASLAITTLFSPKLSKIFGRVKAIVYTHILGIILLILLPLVNSYYLATLIFVLRNTAMNMTGPLFSSFILNLIPKEERARGQSLINLIDSIPRSFGPSIGGYLFYLGRLDIPFFITSGLYSIATLGFYLFFKDVR